MKKDSQQNSKSADQGISRRGFLAASAAAVAAPMILPQGVLAAKGRPGANDRIVTGHIGIGGMGSGHLNAFRGQAGALCDVDKNHLARAVDIVGRKIDAYEDYRRVLDRKDIDAVIIAAPDHWHGVMTVQACEAGKDVYCEKPASNTIEEGQAMCRAAERYGRVIQIGSQGRSQQYAYKACQYIKNGQIGDVQRVECWHYENPVGGDPAKNGPAPDEINWDLYIGPNRWVPYNPDRTHFNFRWFLEYGGGQIRDRGAHVLSLVSWFLDLDDKGPVRVTATGEPPHEGLWDCPTTMEATWEFKNPDLTVVWTQPGLMPKPNSFGAVYKGTKDELVVFGGDGGGTTTDRKVTEYEPPADGVPVFKSPGHYENWFDCIRTREKPIMNIWASHRVASMCILGNLAYRLGRPLKWDPATERFVNDEEANRLLSIPGRGPWHL